jgi:hypothetical protein
MRVHRASGNDIPLAVLNNQSLNQVFVGGQLVANGDFSNGLTNWQKANDSGASVLSVTDNELYVVPNLGFRKILNTSQLSSSTNDVIYTRYSGRADNNLLLIPYFRNGTNTSFPIISYASQYMNFTTTQQNFSHLFTLDGNVGFLWIENETNVNYYLDDVYFINLTSLGIATLTKSQLDYLFQVWQFNNLNALVARQFIQKA